VEQKRKNNFLFNTKKHQETGAFFMPYNFRNESLEVLGILIPAFHSISSRIHAPIRVS
jgi:hypothetical protein